MIDHYDVSDATVRLAESLEEVTPLPCPEPIDYKRDAPRSTIMEAFKLAYPGTGDREGTKVPLNDRPRGIGDPRILSAYKISDHGFFKGRSENAVLLVPTADYHAGRDEDEKPRAIVAIYLTEDDPLYDDVLPIETMYAMQKAGGTAKELKLAYESFWVKARAEHDKKVKAEAQAVLAQEEPAPPVNAAPEPEPNDPIVVDIDPVDKQPVQQVKREVELVAADMSAAQYAMITESGRLALDAFKEAWPARPALLGSVIGFGILEGILEVESAECELATALVQVTEGTRRIQGVTCEEVRTDRWRVSLFCREAVGRVVTPHVVHVTPGVAGPLYRVTGSRKYPHQVEVLNYVTASFDAAYHLYV